MSEIHTIPRTGRRSLRFTGERIANADNAEHNKYHWIRAAVYRRPGWAKAYRYVLVIAHLTCVEGETDKYNAILCLTDGELADYIEQLPDIIADKLFDELGIVEDLDAREQP